MSDYDAITQNFKVGVLKELHRREFITRDELEKVIKAIREQYTTCKDVYVYGFALIAEAQRNNITY